MDITIPEINEKLTKLIHYCNHNNKKLLIGTDSNSHRPLWGSKDSNSRGEMIEEMIFQYNLQLLNDGVIPTFWRREANVSTFIDLTMTTANLVDYVTNWRVDQTDSFSDHLYIKFEISQDIIHKEQSLDYDQRKADWNKFRKIISKHIQGHDWNVTSAADLDYKAELLQNIIQESIKEACPPKKSLDRQIVPWWTTELTNKRKQLRAEGRRSTKSGNWQIYRRLRVDYDHLIKREKEKSWREFCSEVKNITSTSKLVKILKGADNRDIGLIKKGPNDNSFTKTPEETLEVLMNTHFPNSTNIDELEDTDKPKVWFQDGCCSIEINLETTTEIFRSFLPYKAPGPDGIMPVALANLPDEAISIFAKLFRHSLRNRYSAKCWRQMKVVFIAKPNKENYFTAKMFRPITLSDSLSKA